MPVSGDVHRQNAFLVDRLLQEKFGLNATIIQTAISSFPGCQRRLELLSLKDPALKNKMLYTDYAHHPAEIKAVIRQVQDRHSIVDDGKGKLAVVYQPHQNRRQHKVLSEYKDAFSGCSSLALLPTFLAREDPELDIITPEQVRAAIEIPKAIEIFTEKNNELASLIRKLLVEEDKIVLCIAAGDLDGWLRKQFCE